MRKLCCGGVGSGMTFPGISIFWGVLGIEVFVGSTLGAGVGFSGDLSLCFICDAVLSVSTLRAPPFFNLIGFYVLGYEVSSSFGVGSLYLIFLRTFGFT